MKVVFICRRNRFRSQIAEGLLNHLVKDSSYAISAGIDTLPEERGVLFCEYKNDKVKNTLEAMIFSKNMQRKLLLKCLQMQIKLFF